MSFTSAWREVETGDRRAAEVARKEQEEGRAVDLAFARPGECLLPSPDYYARVRPAGLTLNINLTTLQLPPDTYSGTLFLQAQAI